MEEAVDKQQGKLMKHEGNPCVHSVEDVYWQDNFARHQHQHFEYSVHLHHGKNCLFAITNYLCHQLPLTVQVSDHNLGKEVLDWNDPRGMRGQESDAWHFLTLQPFSFTIKGGIKWHFFVGEVKSLAGPAVISMSLRNPFQHIALLQTEEIWQQP